MDKIMVEDLDLFYGNFQALKKINVAFKEHEITALIGPSGCGKSTLLKTLNRMNDLVEGCHIKGTIRLDGEDIYGNMDINLLRKRVGMVFQKPNPFPMSIYDNVAFGARTHGIRSKAALDEIVERSLKGAAIWDEVKDRLKKSALGMSGGQQQRLCIARALAVEPEVLLMDEPTSALDPIAEEEIFGTINSYLEDKTVIYISHRFSASKIADKIYFMENGRIIEQGTHDELIRQKGKYADMFNLQAKYYKDDSSECIG